MGLEGWYVVRIWRGGSGVKWPPTLVAAFLVILLLADNLDVRSFLCYQFNSRCRQRYPSRPSIPSLRSADIEEILSSVHHVKRHVLTGSQESQVAARILITDRILGQGRVLR